MDESNLQNVSSKLKTVICGDRHAMDEICIQLKAIIDESKGWRVDAEHASTTLSQNQEKITLWEQRLAQTCTETNEIKSVRWLYEQIHKDVGFYCLKNTSNSTQDPCITSVIDLLSKYDQNCRQKEGLENMLNQVHRKFTKFKAKHAHYSGSNTKAIRKTSMVFPCTEKEADVSVEENMCADTEKDMHIDSQNVQVDKKEKDTFGCNENVHHDSGTGKFQLKLTARRKPMTPLDMNLLAEDHSQESAKSDSLTKVRSPVLCAYLRKRKD